MTNRGIVAIGSVYFGRFGSIKTRARSARFQFQFLSHMGGLPLLSREPSGQNARADRVFAVEKMNEQSTTRCTFCGFKRAQKARVARAFCVGPKVANSRVRVLSVLSPSPANCDNRLLTTLKQGSWLDKPPHNCAWIGAPSATWQHQNAREERAFSVPILVAHGWAPPLVSGYHQDKTRSPIACSLLKK